MNDVLLKHYFGSDDECDSGCDDDDDDDEEAACGTADTE